MKEQLISFETAKLAKEKGFDIECKNWYDQIEVLHPKKGPSGAMFYENYVYAPTQSLLQKWLREKHNIQIIINFTPLKSNKHSYCYITTNSNSGESNGFLTWFETYEQALEAGLYEALNLLNHEKNI